VARPLADALFKMIDAMSGTEARRDSRETGMCVAQRTRRERRVKRRIKTRAGTQAPPTAR